jgi:hypothetical protein
MAFLPLFPAATSAHPQDMTAFLLLTLFLIALGVLSALGWSADTRDSQDWKPMPWPSARRAQDRLP